MEMPVPSHSKYTVRFLDQSVSEDARMIRDLVKLDWHSLADDGMPYPGDDAIDLLYRGDIVFVGVFGPDLMAMWMVHESSVHTFVPLEARGYARQLGRVTLDWAFSRGGFSHLTTEVPEFNRRARLLAEGVGFRQVGYDRQAGVRGGKPYASRLYKLTKEEHASNSNHHSGG